MLGCSIGVEAYSVAWRIRSARPDLKLILHALDISKWAVEFGKCGRYSLVASQSTDTDIFERMTETEIMELFDRDGDVVTVKSWIKEGIKWQVGDVAEAETLDALGPQSGRDVQHDRGRTGRLPVWQMTNDYSVCNYFQAIDRPENQEFVRSSDRFGETCVVSDTIDTAYNSVRLWAQAVREAETTDLSEVRPALLRQSLNAAEGVISIDRESQHTWRPFFVGRIKSDGQIEIIETLSKPIRPVPFPFSRRRDEWESALNALSAVGRKVVAP